jgi:hypothetical protein
MHLSPQRRKPGHQRTWRAITFRSLPPYARTRESPTLRLRLTAACDVSFPLRVGFDEHPLMPHVVRSVVWMSVRDGQMTGSPALGDTGPTARLAFTVS